MRVKIARAVSNKRCLKCKSTGHLIRNCPMNSEETEGVNTEEIARTNKMTFATMITEVSTGLREEIECTNVESSELLENPLEITPDEFPPLIAPSDEPEYSPIRMILAT